MASVFVSHSHLDDMFGLQLIGDLKHHLGESAVWYDASGGLHGGDEWWRTIVAAITSHDIFLVILTPAAMTSEWVTREMEIAYYQHVKQGKRLLPILLQPCMLPTHWELIHSLNFTDTTRYQQNLTLLLAEIARVIPTAPIPPFAATTTNVPTLVVDQLHRGDHTTISAAITAARPGTRILIRPGLYREGLVIDKPLEIIGDGDRDDIIIEATGKDVVLFLSTASRVGNLTLRQMGGGDWYGVDIAQGRLELEECNITSQSLAGISVHNGAYARMRRNRLHNCSTVGIYLFGQGQGIIEDNMISDNAEGGITIRERGNSIVRRNKIMRNGAHAIWVCDGGGGDFSDNDLRGNAQGAWLIEPDCIQNVQRTNNKE